MITIKNLTTHQIKALYYLCEELAQVVLEQKRTNSDITIQSECNAAIYVFDLLTKKIAKKAISNKKKYSIDINPAEAHFFTTYYTIAPTTENWSFASQINLLLYQKIIT